MSGLVKKVKKVFKKVTKFVKKYWKEIVIATAVYFTAGVALSYFESTAAFASSMPGFGEAGIFTKAATFLGFNGSAAVKSGLSVASGAWQGSSVVPFGTTLAEEAARNLTPVVVEGSMKAGPTFANAAEYAAAGGKTAATVASTVAPAAASTDALIKSLSTAYKLQAVSTLIGTASGLLSPSQKELYEAQHNLQWGNAFGVDRQGNAMYGWASTGGSDAFANMHIPPSQQLGPPPIPKANTGSQYANLAGNDFLSGPFNAKTPVETNPYTNMDAQQADFLTVPQQGMA